MPDAHQGGTGKRDDDGRHSTQGGMKAMPRIISIAASTPVKAVMEPTERSMPPVMITRISPIASKANDGHKAHHDGQVGRLEKNVGFLHPEKQAQYKKDGSNASHAEL